VSNPDLSWVKSSLSFANGNCVEVADLPSGGVGVRDSKDAEGPFLRFTPDEWRAFLGGVRNGEFDRIGNLWSLRATFVQYDQRRGSASRRSSPFKLLTRSRRRLLRRCLSCRSDDRGLRHPGDLQVFRVHQLEELPLTTRRHVVAI